MSAKLNRIFHFPVVLPDSERDDLEEKIDMEDLRQIVGSCDNKKSPWLNGLIYEFNKVTINIIEKDLLEVLQCQLDRGRIVDSNKEGVTRLCPKVDVPAEENEA